MPAFEAILTKSYTTFTDMELDVIRVARQDGFVVTKQNMNRSEGVIERGRFCCYKSGRPRLELGAPQRPIASSGFALE